MNQTSLLLASVHGDFTNAHNILTLVSMHAIPTTIENTMYAYMVAKDWCDWITNPDTPNNPLHKQNVDFSPHLKMFQLIRDCFERELLENTLEVRDAFIAVNPNLVSLLRSPIETVKENTTMFFRSLRCTADLFKEKLGTKFYHEILTGKFVP